MNGEDIWEENADYDICFDEEDTQPFPDLIVQAVSSAYFTADHVRIYLAQDPTLRQETVLSQLKGLYRYRR